MLIVKVLTDRVMVKVLPFVEIILWVPCSLNDLPSFRIRIPVNPDDENDKKHRSIDHTRNKK